MSDDTITSDLSGSAPEIAALERFERALEPLLNILVNHAWRESPVEFKVLWESFLAGDCTFDLVATIAVGERTSVRLLYREKGGEPQSLAALVLKTVRPN